MASFSFGIVFFNVATFFLKTADSLILLMIFSMIVLTSPNFINLGESPLWLIKQKRYREAVDVFKYIASVNNRSVPTEYFDGFQKALEENNFTSKADGPNQKLSILGKIRLIFREKKYRKSLLINSTISASLFMVYYGVTTSVQDLGFETVQYNGMLVGVTQAVGFLCVLKHLPVTKRKPALIFIQANLLLGAFLLVCLSFVERSTPVLIVQGCISTLYMSTMISSMFSFLYVTNAEAFPTQVRGMAVGLVLLIGKLTGSAAPYINLFSKHMKVHVLVGSSVPLFLSLFLTFFIKETFTSASTQIPRKQI